MKTAYLPLIALVASFSPSCSKQAVVDVAELEERLSQVEQSYQKLGKSIAQERQKYVRVEAERKGMVNDRLVANEKLETMAEEALKLREEFVRYRTAFLTSARSRAKGLQIPQIEHGGRVFTGVIVKDTANDILSFTHQEGSSQIAMSELDEETQMLVGYDAEKPQEEEIHPTPEQMMSLAIEAGQKARENVYASLKRKPAPVKKEAPVSRPDTSRRPAWMSRSSFEGPSMAPYGGERRKVSRAN